MLEVKNLSVSFGKKKAVTNLSFSVQEKNNLGIIGESGSGKSTLAKAILRLLPKKHISHDSQVFFLNQPLFQLSQEALKKMRKNIQIVFQDPFSSFNPRLPIGKTIEEGLEIHGINNPQERKEKARALLSEVGISLESYDSYPHEFSGGQRQRIAIARSLILNPSLLFADEPVSSLDVSVQAQILNLMLDLKEKHSLTYVLIAHDLSVVDYFCDHILVLYQGELMEYGPKSILQNPFHPYTELLLDSLPSRLNKKHTFTLPNCSVSSLCPFFHRCKYRNKKCADYDGSYHLLSENHQTTCIGKKL